MQEYTLTLTKNERDTLLAALDVCLRANGLKGALAVAQVGAKILQLKPQSKEVTDNDTNRND
jgi:hypothetical protein